MIPNIPRGAALTHEQQKARQAWMVQEAQRLIEARRATQRPAQPVQINQIHDPRQQPQKTQDDFSAEAQMLIDRLRERDRNNYGGR